MTKLLKRFISTSSNQTTKAPSTPNRDKKRLFSSFGAPGSCLGAKYGKTDDSPFFSWQSPIKDSGSPHVIQSMDPLPRALSATDTANDRILYRIDTSTTVLIPKEIDRTNKAIVPAKFMIGDTSIAAVAVVTTDIPRPIPVSQETLGILAKFQLNDGRNALVLRRGITHREMWDWLKPRSETIPLKMAFYLQKTVESAEVLKILHSHGIAHMDIKSSNMVTYPDGSGLIDIEKAPMIGAARGFDYDSFYASPSKPHYASEKSDVYSLGESLRVVKRCIPDSDQGSVGDLTPLLRAMTSAKPDQRPELQACIAKLREIIPGLATSQEISELHTAFVSEHDPIFNPENPSFFEEIPLNTSWDD